MVVGCRNVVCGTNFISAKLCELYKGYPKTSKIGQACEMATGLGKNSQIKCQASFLTAFRKKFWDPNYPWLHRKDQLTKLDGHSCQEVLIQVFLMSKQLQMLEEGGWKTVPEFSQLLI